MYLWATFCLFFLGIRAVIILIYNGFDITNPFVQTFGETVLWGSIIFLATHLEIFLKSKEKEIEYSDILQDVDLLKAYGFRVSDLDMLEGHYRGYFCRILAIKTKEKAYACDIECVVQIKEYDVESTKKEVPLRLEETALFYLFTEQIIELVPISSTRVLDVLNKMIDICEKHHIKAHTPYYAQKFDR
ncbi:MAG: hypothetical protein EAZ95_11320 [Bacteroidetes bacterium]|nr:MAG: hypothetical protein EAZ95_11320 [Bacteroidota bacterium]